MAAAPDIHGTVAPGFEPVRDAFTENFTRRGEVGAGVCIWHRGRLVVDLWGGVADPASGRAWEADTPTTMFSSTKGMSALCLLMLAERGRLDYDAPVADYWPGFAQAGKAGITVRTLLNHRAGVVGFDEPLCIEDFELRPERVVEICERQAPAWEPGTKQGYHGVTFGPYAAELFRRASGGQTIGQFFAEHVAGPLGADVYIGLPEEHDARVATTLGPTLADKLLRVVPKLFLHRGIEGRVFRQAVQRSSCTRRAFAHPADLGAAGLANYNTYRVRRLELPWCNGVGTARGLARVYQALVAGGTLDGVTLARPESLTPVHARQSWVERDEVLRKPLGFSQGFIKEETHLFCPNTTMFGHPGAGGSLGMADPTAGVALGYVMNKMGPYVRSPRALALCHALYRSPGLQAGQAA
ncbi:MAG: beta-lactamase family protein [Myxococcales bacterium]|nr:beta-lactamase family protein [Myxococcales bacterium]